MKTLTIAFIFLTSLLKCQNISSRFFVITHKDTVIINKGRIEEKIVPKDTIWLPCYRKLPHEAKIDIINLINEYGDLLKYQLNEQRRNSPNVELSY